jgi:hypothetical protein
MAPNTTLIPYPALMILDKICAIIAVDGPGNSPVLVSGCVGGGSPLLVACSPPARTVGPPYNVEPPDAPPTSGGSFYRPASPRVTWQSARAHAS